MTTQTTDKEELEKALKSFTGTESYFKHWSGLKYTDGVKYLFDNAGCYWLGELIASYLGEVDNVDFEVWQLYKEGDSSRVTMREDGTDVVLIEQAIEYTDFPLDYVELWLIDGVLLLPSEY